MDEAPRFVIQFIDIAQSLVDYDHHIEGLEEIVECSERWRDELGTICKLAPEVNELTEKLVNECEHKMHSNKNMARRLQEWGENRALDAEKVPDMHHDNVVDEIQRGLISLALHPSPWNGYAGEKIGKRAEGCLFDRQGFQKSHKQRSCTKQKYSQGRFDLTLRCMTLLRGASYSVMESTLRGKMHPFHYSERLLQDLWKRTVWRRGVLLH